MSFIVTLTKLNKQKWWVNISIEGESFGFEQTNKVNGLNKAFRIINNIKG